MFNKYFTIAMAVCCLAVCQANAATIVGPTPYLATSDTPAGVFDADHLLCIQDFENADGPWETGFSIDVGQRIGPKFTSGAGVPVTDSVDADDNAIDGDGTMGSSWFTATSALNITFDEATTAASFVFTDADKSAQEVTITAYDANDAVLVSQSYESFFDDVFTGTTQEDRFFGIRAMGDELIKRIRVSLDQGRGLEIDHVQFAKAEVVPEPAAAALALAGLCGLLGFRRRRR